jgi:putative flippase GtrA
MALQYEPRGRRPLYRQVITFGVVGIIGFVVDASVLYLARWIGLGLFLGRIASYMTAATTTWILNRQFTFAGQGGRALLHEWLLFMLSQLSGAAFNLGIYGWLVVSSTRVAAQPVLGVAVGSVAGMAVNFMVARRFVFRDP